MYQATTPSVTTVQLSSIPSGAAGVRHTLQLMRALVQRGKVSWPVRQRAQILIANLPQQDYVGEARALHAWVRDHIRYTRDIRGVETLHTADKVLEIGQGDCDDKSVLLASMLASIGFKTRFKAVGFRPGHYVHVYPEALIGNRWVALETTKPWPIGQEPPAIRSVMLMYNDD